MMRLDLAVYSNATKETVLGIQQEIYYRLVGEGKMQQAKQFIEEQDLRESDLEDHRPIVTLV